MKIKTIVTIFLMACANTQVFALDPLESFYQTLLKYDIAPPSHHSYTDVVDYLLSIKEDKNIARKEQVNKYLDENIGNLVKIETAKPGLLGWYVEKLNFLPNNILFIEYSDGEMCGGELLLELKCNNGEISEALVMWDSHE